MIAAGERRGGAHPWFPIKGKRDWVASSTVSLKASDGECPFSRRTLYWARNIPSVARADEQRSAGEESADANAGDATYGYLP